VPRGAPGLDVGPGDPVLAAEHADIVDQRAERAVKPVGGPDDALARRQAGDVADHLANRGITSARHQLHGCGEGRFASIHEHQVEPVAGEECGDRAPVADPGSARSGTCHDRGRPRCRCRQWLLQGSVSIRHR